MTELRFGIAAFLISITWNPQTYAVFQYQFRGTVTSVAPELMSEFSVDEVVSGTVDFSPWPIDPNAGIYVVDSLSANIGGDYTIESVAGSLRVFDNSIVNAVTLELTDRAHQFEASPVAGHVPDYFFFNLRYDVDELGSSDLLDQFILSSTIDRSGLRFDVEDSLAVGFRLDTFSIVPESDVSYVPVVVCAYGFIARRRRSPGSNTIAC